MARPTDPEKLAALRARQAANSRAYRARQKAKRAAERGDAPPKPRASPGTEAAVRRAHESRDAAKARRNKVIGEFPSARNPAVNVYTPRDVPTTPAGMPDTPAKRRQRIRVLKAATEAQRLQSIGRARKEYYATAMQHDARAASIRENLTPSQRARMQKALTRISKVSQQTLAIFLQYEGGEGDLQSAFTQLAYPNGQDPEDALGRVESIADTIERAEGLYGPKAVGRLRI